MGKTALKAKAKKKRKQVSKKTRFDVFKRDDFTCQYCGRKTPTVILEVDHIVPLAGGGGHEFENLATSCYECNRGKGAIPLDKTPEKLDLHARAVTMLERELQLREYNHVKGMRRQREDKEIVSLLKYWDGLGFTYQPKRSCLRNYLRRIPGCDIADAMEITAENRVASGFATRYLFGVLKRMAAEREIGVVDA